MKLSMMEPNASLVAERKNRGELLAQHRDKPLIGVNADYRSARNGLPDFVYLARGYVRCLTKAGAVPLVIPSLEEETELCRILDALDGVVLCGGGDLDCRRDGFMLHPSMRLVDPYREESDRMLVRLVAERQMPVLGIGCGMQLLNVAFGGNLLLHLPEDAPSALPHFDGTDPHHGHPLVVEPGSLMERVYGEGEIRVNSMHHMAIDEVAPGFRVTARCPDGVIEAIESATLSGSTDEVWAVGVQFHPEDPRGGTKLDAGVFECFVEGVGRSRRAHKAA